MNNYKVSPPVWLLTKTKDGEKVSFLKGKKDGAKKNEFDILNWNFYDKKGNVVRVPTQSYQDEKFIETLLSISPVERIEDFLNYQFENSREKLNLIKHLNTGAIINSPKIKQHPPTQKIFIDWLKGKKELRELTLLKENFESAKKWFDEKYYTLTDSVAREKFLKSEIQRTENSIQNTYLKNLTLLDSEKLKEYEGGVLFLTYLNGLIEETPKDTADKLTHRQQILTLHLIGFFDLPIFQTLSAVQKGVLVSHLLNRTPKDSEDLIRYFHGKKKDKKFDTKTPENIKRVKQLLKKIGREDIEIK